MTTSGIVWLVIALLGGVLLLAAVLAALLAVRVRRLDRRVGSFECVLRAEGTDWVGGIAVYGVGQVRWYRLMSLSLRPTRVFVRERLELVERVDDGSELVEVRCRYRGEEEERLSLALRRDSLAGLVSWLEAAPPRGQPLW